MTTVWNLLLGPNVKLDLKDIKAYCLLMNVFLYGECKNVYAPLFMFWYWLIYSNLICTEQELSSRAPNISYICMNECFLLGQVCRMLHFYLIAHFSLTLNQTQNNTLLSFITSPSPRLWGGQKCRKSEHKNLRIINVGKWCRTPNFKKTKRAVTRVDHKREAMTMKSSLLPCL